MSRILLFFLAFVSVFQHGCARENDPDRLAKGFVDAYYIEYDFERALTFAQGAAVMRLEREKALVDDARQKVAVAQSRSRTYYSEPEKRQVQPDLIHYTFELEIRMGSSDIRRTAIIMLAAVKKLCPSLGKPVVNMWCTHSPNPINPVETSASTSAV